MTQTSTIFGLSILEDEIFALGYNNNTITVYDKAKLKIKRRFSIVGMQFPGDIKTITAAQLAGLQPEQDWHKKPCLFVIDWTKLGENKKMFILDKIGIIQGQWAMEDDFGRLSLTEKTPPTFVEVFHDQNAIAEFTIDGNEIRKIPILPDQGITGLQHASQLRGGNFLVSHGDPKDDLHRVCIVDENGKKLKSFGSTKGDGDDKLNVPVYLGVDSKGTIIVADKFNNRILLLTSDLDFQRELIHFDGSLLPVKMLLEENEHKLYVAFNRGDPDKTDDGDRMKMMDGHIMTVYYEN